MKIISALDEAVRLIKANAEATEVKEARRELNRLLAILRSLDAPSDLLLSLKREGGNALNPKRRNRHVSVEGAIWAVHAWKEENGFT